MTEDENTRKVCIPEPKDTSIHEHKCLVLLAARISEPLIITKEDIALVSTDLWVVLQHFMSAPRQIELLNEVKQWHDTGKMKLFEIYEDMKKHGKSAEWNESGNLLTLIMYNRGEKHGESKEWDEKGNLLTLIMYNRGEKHGESREWGKNGNLWSLTIYNHGEKDGECELYNHEEGKEYRNGALTIHNYMNGLLHGQTRHYLKNGKLDCIKTYRLGKLHGLWTYYRINGQLWQTDKYENGVQHGKSMYWHENGELGTIDEYNNGNMI